ncbi:hypothetical protein OPV22_025765 [Ensete ventricosum]|uniref:Uncharacterized protein n=1 Tax=Ensete ventricosum TaxID=4639 RepID=A0AAV8QIB0_ENSVE|nr:hypothetical protein OPV22_025765 [Ensete ventricosum]
MVGCNNLYPVIEVEEPLSSRTNLKSMEAIDPGFSDVVAKPGPEVSPSSPEFGIVGRTAEAIIIHRAKVLS